MVLLTGGCCTLMAQTYKVNLTGTMIMSTGERFPYKLVLTENNGRVKGYSLTYPEPDETRALVEGTLDRKARTLTFRETEIVYSHSYRTKAFMCLADATLEYRQVLGSNELKGPASNTEADKTSCTPGTIVFNDDRQISELFSYHEQYDTVITMKKRVHTAPPEPIPVKAAAEEPITTEKVTTGVEKSFDWNTDSLVMEIWDGGNTDGDRVSILYDQLPVLSGYYLVKARKRLSLPVKPGMVHTLAIIAENEGSDPPNTATLLLADGSKRYSVLAYNKRGDRALIRIRKRIQ